MKFSANKSLFCDNHMGAFFLNSNFKRYWFNLSEFPIIVFLSKALSYYSNTIVSESYVLQAEEANRNQIISHSSENDSNIFFTDSILQEVRADLHFALYLYS